MARHQEGESFSVHWQLARSITFLNHGSFGACPREVTAKQREWQDAMERQPVRFLGRKLELALEGARAELGGFVGADPDDLAFVTNATTGVNTVLRSLRFEPGDEVLTTNQDYNACRNALALAAETQDASLVVVPVPFPLAGPDEIVAAVLERVTGRTRLAMIDAISSPTGLIFPYQRLVQELQQRGVDVLIDGAHAPGQLPLDLDELGAAYFTGNCHKWMCTPKGSAFLHVRKDRQDRIRPLTISHGANSPRPDRSRFRLEFDWQGTHDPSPWLCIPAVLQFFTTLLPGGFEEARRRNHELALRGRDLVCEALSVAAPAPDTMLGSMAAIQLPPLEDPSSLRPPLYLDPVQAALLERHKIEIPVMTWPERPYRVIRLSAQLYNEPAQYEELAEALVSILRAA